MRINEDGDVGIGTTDPAQALDVVNTIALSGTTILSNTHASDADFYGNIRVLQNVNQAYSDGMYINYNSNGGANADLRFFANGTTERMRLEASNGYLGIATQVPLAMLDVRGDISGSGNFYGTGVGSRITNNGTPYLLSGDAAAALTLQDVCDNGNTTTTAVGIGTDTVAASNSFEVFGDGAANSTLVVAAGASAGFVGIGSANPTVPLDASTISKANIAARDSYIYSTGSAIFGGANHVISGDFNVVAGGAKANISGGNFNFIGGGTGVDVDYSKYSSSVGGYDNDIFSGDYSVIGGGRQNLISGIVGESHADNIAILGGQQNQVLAAPYSFIGAGNSNLISGSNSIYSSIVGGGYNQIKNSQFATILGGDNNKITSANHSVPAGNYSRVQSGHAGAFVFSDSRTANYDSTGGNTLNLRFESGVFVDTDSGIYIAPDTDVSAVSGRAHVGYVGSDSDVAGFAHVDKTSHTQAALRQTAAGVTKLGCPSSQDIQFLQNNTIIGGFNTSKDFYVDTDTIYVDVSENNVGINDSTPIGDLQVGSNVFSGGNGVYADSRIGLSVNGSLKSMVYASTYNNATYPDYGMVFIHGAGTASDYNVWSISPDGPAKDDGLNFIYGLNATNIHTTTPKVVFKGDGKVGIGTDTPSYELDVNGTTRSTYYIGGAYFEENASDNKIKFYPNGTVLVLDKDGALKPCEKENDSFVFGVSKRDFDQPIVLGAEPVLVTGPIKVGDYIVTSDKQGHGQAAKEPKVGSAIAQAMENGDGESYNIKAMIRKI